MEPNSIGCMKYNYQDFAYEMCVFLINILTLAVYDRALLAFASRLPLRSPPLRWPFIPLL